MADLYIGSQGSGKSYRAVNAIYNGLKDYDRIYTNIDVIEHDKIHKLRFKDFAEDFILPLYDSYIDDELYGDENLVKDLMQFMNIENVSYSDFSILVVLDEASNYYKEKNKLYRWFIEYHRHLNIDFILITQLETSIHLDNRIYNNIYEAWATSRQVIPFIFMYTHYIGKSTKSENKNGLTILRKDKKIFNFYISGRQKKEKNVIAFPFLLLLLLLLLVFYGFKYFLNNSSLSASAPAPAPAPMNHVNNKIVVVKKEDINSTNYNSIYSYFVDEKYLYCNSSLKSVPLVLVPKDTILIEPLGFDFYRFFYSYELKFCIVKKEKITPLQMGIQRNIEEY